MIRKWIVGICLTVVLIWVIWSVSGRRYETVAPQTFLDHFEEIRSDTNCMRNIVAVQPFMIPDDYLSRDRFYAKMDAYFQAARNQHYFGEKTVVVLPEYIASWLVLLNEKRSVVRASNLEAAMRTMILSNPVSFLRHFLTSEEGERTAAALFRMKAHDMAHVYADVFSTLARQYGVTIAGGSLVLPGPVVKDKSIIPDPDEPLYNAGFVFHADGSIDPQVVRKVFPISSELPFTRACLLRDLPVFDLPVGRTAILICADSWYPETYYHIDSLGAEVVLVPSFAGGDNSMEGFWQGYDGAPPPGDVDSYDIGRITARQAWVKYALPGRLTQTSAVVGVNVFLRGNFWELGSDGMTLMVKDGKLMHVGDASRAGIWNLCF
jgi:hypothetical protein